jgi:hypothetical protein
VGVLGTAQLNLFILTFCHIVREISYEGGRVRVWSDSDPLPVGEFKLADISKL